MKKLGLALVAVVLALSVNAQRKIESPFGKGLYNVIAADSSWSMKFGIRFQNLFIAEYDINDSLGIINGNSNFLVRRSRLKFDGFAFSPKLKYKLEVGLTNRDIAGGINSEHRNAPRMILDAVLKWNFAKGFELWAGQTKLPGNRERVVSSANLQFVDRSLVNSRYNIDRDMGFQLRYKTEIGGAIVKAIGSVSQGEGRDVTAGNIGGYDWTTRLEILPFGKFSSKGDYVGSAVKREEKPKLSLAVTYDIHDRAVRERGQLGDFMYNDLGYYETDINTIFFDAMFKYKGWSFMTEFASKEADDPIAKNSDGTATGDVVREGTGLMFALGYMTKKDLEIAGRYTVINPTKEIGALNETQYTLGVSRFFKGHKLKVQTDVSYTTVDDPNDSALEFDSGLMYRLQMDIHF